MLYAHRAWERTLANKRRHDWAMIQFGASTEEVLERWERSRGRRLYGVGPGLGIPDH